MPNLETRIEELYRAFGPGKPMGTLTFDTRHPHFFLHRYFLGKQDLLIIFNTKRCRYQCSFCGLSLKSSPSWIPAEDILAQFEYTICEVKHSLGVLDRVTISNDGSVLDSSTFPFDVLLTIVKCTRKLKNVRRLVMETRIEFVEPTVVRQIQDANPTARINILAGFETLDTYIRDTILGKCESLDSFLTGLDKIAECSAELTAFVLFKPSYTMTDKEAVEEAEVSIDFLAKACRSREIPLAIRLGPMYAAEGTKWKERALATPEYAPPRLTDVLALAEKKSREGTPVYIGLSSEGIAETGHTYQSREDFSKGLLKRAILHNYGKPGSGG